MKNFITEFEKRNTAPQNVNRQTPTLQETKNILIKVTRRYYAVLGSDSFDANKHYAPKVSKYYNNQQLTPNSIKDLYYNGFYPEFVQPEFKFDENSFSLKQVNGLYELTFEGIFTCYRKAKGKYEFARVKSVIRYDKQHRIESIYEADIWDIKFTETRIPT